MRIDRIDHVQLAMPVGREDDARSFYSGLLGMEEVPKPTSFAGRGGCWFLSGDAQVHLGVEEGFRPARKAHPALVAHDITSLLAQLEAAGVPVTDVEPLDGYHRAHVEDPFGNRIELMGRIED